MKPELCLVDNYVVLLDEVATHMYFIKSGLVQIISTDNKTSIAYMSDGAYFGEIGVLITQKRSCSVLARSVCILYSISKEDLTTVLMDYPL